MFEKCIYFNLVTLTRQINKIWQQEFSRLGMAPSHGYLLFAVVENPRLSQKALSELLELDASTITRFIDTLIAKGLVEKDGRGKGAVLSVTAEGKKEYKRVKALMNALYSNMQQHFGKEEFAEFVASLSTAKHSLQDLDT